MRSWIASVLTAVLLVSPLLASEQAWAQSQLAETPEAPEATAATPEATVATPEATVATPEATHAQEAPPWAAESDAQPGNIDERPPPSARTNALIVGGAVTAGFYGMAFGTSYLWPSSPVAGDLRVPVIGPYSAVFGAGCGDRERGCGTFVAVLRTTLASLSALGQTGGVLMLAEAVFLRTDGSSASASAVSPAPSQVSPARSQSAAVEKDVVYYAPIVDESTLGLAIGGSF